MGRRLRGIAVVAAGLSYFISAQGVLAIGTLDQTDGLNVGGREVTIDFSTFGAEAFDPLFYQSEGIVFPTERCGPAGCAGWTVGFIQGDEALVGNSLLGPIAGTFSRPVFGLELRAAPAVQGTATYTLTAFDRSGHVVAEKSATVTQDSGDPETGPQGYFAIDLGRFRKPAWSFTLDSVFVRSSFGYTNIEYGVSSITFTVRGRN